MVKRIDVLKRWICICLAVILCTGIFGTVENIYAANKSAKIPKLKISRTKLDVKLDGEKVLKVSGGTGKFKWKSSDKRIVTVTKSGVVKGKKCGSAIITVTSGKQSMKCRVKVFATKRFLKSWVESKGRYYYFDRYGQKVKGKMQIGENEFYFDSDGRQRTGWQKIGKDYYFYNIAKGRNGSLIKNAIVHQIEIDQTGKAIVTEDNKRKLKALVLANDVVFNEIDWTMTKKEALMKLYMGFAKGESIVYKNIGGFKSAKGWPERYALTYLENGYGDCYTTNCAFAYLALSLGYNEIYTMSSGHHGWCRIEGLYYDPRWAYWGTSMKEKGFAVPENLCGKEGRMNWKYWRYSEKIS